ncbi:2Fe-2S iron-sulfur cluster-binding protein [Streptomyces sp. NPDC059446]|uniref:2Fe-2S iron-sulfur cluster-binding protein n=1 Tax=Streptomyces sp. NPDC059446 TaxID=3346833 RepID=UPI00367D6BE6
MQGGVTPGTDPTTLSEPMGPRDVRTLPAGRYTGGAAVGTVPTVPHGMSVEEDGRPVGTVVVEPGRTLLDAGLAAGLPMPHSCTVGNCGECTVRLREGEVTQGEPNCLTPRQRAEGYVLACMSCPLSKVTLDIADP